MTKSQALQEAIDQVRRDIKAATGRRKKILVDGGVTKAVAEELLALDLRLQEAVCALREIMAENQAAAHARVSAVATSLVGGIRAMCDARIDALQPPEDPKEVK
jgi:hypothetical protein